MTSQFTRKRPLLRSTAATLLLFSALAIVWTWPLAAHLSSRIPHDPGDPILVTWILWWNAHTVPFSSAWWNPPIFFPLPGALALTEHFAGVSVIATPLQLAGANPLVAYNLSLVLTYVLSGFFAYLLVRRLTGCSLAGFCAGLAFGFAPYRAGQLAHLQVLSSQWMPAALLGLHEYVRSGRKWWLVLFGTAWVIQALSNGYYMLFLPVLIALWLAWFIHWRTASGRAAGVLIAWTVASLPLLPIALKYHAIHVALGLSRTADEVRRYSATFASFLHPPRLLAVWPAQPTPTDEDYLFPGGTALTVTLVALIVLSTTGRLREAIAGRSPLVFYSAATVMMWMLAFGLGQEDAPLGGWLYPYRWISWLPGYEGLRAPARFAMLGSLCLALAAGFAVASVRRTFSRRIVGAVVAVGIALDGLMEPLPIAPRPPRAILPGPASSAVIEIPPDDARVSVGAMYRAMFHQRPLVNGYSGHMPPHYSILSLALRRGDPSPLLYLARDRPLVIIINDRSDPDGMFRTMVERLPGIRPDDASAAGATFVLPSQRATPIAVSGHVLQADLSESGRDRLEVDLHEPRRVDALEFDVRWRYGSLAERLLIEASDDRAAWREIWLGWTGAPVFQAALQDPRATPVRIALEGVRTRYLRIWPAPPWLTTELRVLGTK